MRGAGLTRRSVVGRAAGATLALLVGRTAEALARVTDLVGIGRGGGRQVFDLAIGAVSGHSATVTAPRRFDMVGVSWTGASRGADVELRVRGADGWSGWVRAGAHGHGPDAGDRRAGAAAPRSIGDPVWAGDADAVQLRCATPLQDVRLHFVKARLDTTPALAARSRYATPIYNSGPGQPRVIARHVWANAACRPRVRAGYGEVSVAFVHHTENPNGYSRSHSAALVQSICLFHKYVHGWNDIGYNFLVDRYGQIFEGRAGGIDEPTVGAQAGGYNFASTGVAVIGDFTGAPPTAAAMRALAHVLAWKLALHGVPARGETEVVVSSGGRAYSRYRPGSSVRLNRISGHRDGDSTTCPGNALYRQLPALRRHVEALAGPIGSLTLSGPPAGAVFGAPAPISGVLSVRDGAPIAAAAIELQVRNRDRARPLSAAVTAADGTWSAAVAAPHNVVLRAVYAGGNGHSAVVSPVLALEVAPAVVLAAAAPQVAAGQPLPISGIVTPAKKAVHVEVLVAGATGTFGRIAVVDLAVAPTGAFTGTVTLPAPGHYRLVALTAADSLNGAGASAPVDVVAS